MTRPDPGVEPVVVDARGRRCPLPVIDVARAVQRHVGDGVVVLLADDPAARFDVPAWGRLRGHDVEVEDRGDHTAYRVVVEAARGSAQE